MILIIIYVNIDKILLLNNFIMINKINKTNSFQNTPPFIWAVLDSKNKVNSILDNNFILEKSINYTFYIKTLTEKLNNWNLWWINNIIKDILTTRPEYLESKINSNNWENFLIDLKDKFSNQIKYYNDLIDLIEKKVKSDNKVITSDNPAWFSIKSINNKDIKNNINYKIYTTIPFKQYTYIKNFYQLWLLLNDLAISTNDNISVKIPKTLLWFLSHSDSIVIHFKNQENKTKIEEILKIWLTNNWLNEEERNLWRTKFAADPKNEKWESFSTIIWNHIEKWIIDNYKKYDNSILAKEAIKHAIELSKKPPNFI